MSEHSDLALYLGGVEKKLAQHDAALGKDAAAIAELQRKFAVLDQAQKTFNNQIEIFRTAINEDFRRLREVLGGR